MGELETKFGDLLQLERERQKITLADLATELKISEDSLASIEKGDAGSLPSEPYYKMFSKTYAERLGIDYAKTIDAIREELGESLEPELKVAGERKEGEPPESGKKAVSDKEAEEDEEEPSEEKAFIKKVIYISAAIVVVFILVLVGYKFIFGGGEESAVPGERVEEADGPSPTESANAEFANYQWGVPENARPESLLVTLTSREQSWATVLADGDTVLYQNLTPWREYNVKAAYRVLVSIGIPRLVDIKLDGTPVNLVNATSGRISRVEINQSNRTMFEPPAAERPRPASSAPAPAQDTTSPAPPVETETKVEDSL
ncbi:MAG: helix-turn-helix domain-containing protein [bacterium]|nr:helix-turn-helix domain-containing protein [bacterium]